MDKVDRELMAIIRGEAEPEPITWRDRAAMILDGLLYRLTILAVILGVLALVFAAAAAARYGWEWAR